MVKTLVKTTKQSAGVIYQHENGGILVGFDAANHRTKKLWIFQPCFSARGYVICQNMWKLYLFQVQVYNIHTYLYGYKLQ